MPYQLMPCGCLNPTAIDQGDWWVLRIAVSASSPEGIRRGVIAFSRARGTIKGDTRTLMDVSEDAELRLDPLLDFQEQILRWHGKKKGLRCFVSEK